MSDQAIEEVVRRSWRSKPDSPVETQNQRIAPFISKHRAITHRVLLHHHATMPPRTEAKALKHLAAILTDTLRILSNEIHYHRSIPPGSTRYCNHSDTEFLSLSITAASIGSQTSRKLSPSLSNDKYSSDYWFSALTEPPNEATLEMIKDAKEGRDYLRFVASTRMTRAVWWLQSEVEFEEVMDDHSRNIAREEERMLVRTPIP
jgi:hypothetical protein